MTKQREAGRGNGRRTDAKSAFWGNPGNDRAAAVALRAVAGQGSQQPVQGVAQRAKPEGHISQMSVVMVRTW